MKLIQKSKKNKIKIPKPTKRIKEINQRSKKIKKHQNKKLLNKKVL